VRTSDALCRAMPSLTSRLLDLRSPRSPKGAHPHVVTMTPRGGPHRARAVETAVGLGRRTPSGPERLPLDRLEPRSPSGQMSRSLFTRAASTPHPVACCERAPPRQRPASHLRLSSRRHPRVAPQAASTRKARLTNFCNRLTKRAPSGLSDSRAHPESLATFRVQSHPRPMTSVGSRVEPR